MVNQQVVADFSKKLKEILNDVLAIGDWNSSVFLKTSALKLNDIICKAEKLSGNVEVLDENIGSNQRSSNEQVLGVSRVFVLLYQVDGSNLQGWYSNIKTLLEYGVSKSVYQDENYAKELVRSKTLNIERNGYVIVDVKDDDFYQTDKLDAFGHQLFALRENAIKLEKVIEFIHANKKRYVIRNNELVLLGDI